MRGFFTAFFKTLFTPFLFFTHPTEGRPQSENYTWQDVAMGGGGFVSDIITSTTEQNFIYARTRRRRCYAGMTPEKLLHEYYNDARESGCAHDEIYRSCQLETDQLFL